MQNALLVLWSSPPPVSSKSAKLYAKSAIEGRVMTMDGLVYKAPK